MVMTTSLYESRSYSFGISSLLISSFEYLSYYRSSILSKTVLILMNLVQVSTFKKIPSFKHLTAQV
jgi:hypothetical protein